MGRHLARPQAFLDNLGEVFTRWDNEAFDVTTMFASAENVAVFGNFRYRSNSFGHMVTSPFSILVKVIDGKVTYLQLLEDSYATAARLPQGTFWVVQTEVGGELFGVGTMESFTTD